MGAALPAGRTTPVLASRPTAAQHRRGRTADRGPQSGAEPMTPPSLSDPLDRVRREVERSAIRARNGIKYLAGNDWTTPQPTPKDTVWRQGDVQLWRYRSDQVTVGPPVLMFIGLVSRSSIFDLHE